MAKGTASGKKAKATARALANMRDNQDPQHQAVKRHILYLTKANRQFLGDYFGSAPSGIVYIMGALPVISREMNLDLANQIGSETINDLVDEFAGYVFRNREPLFLLGDTLRAYAKKSLQKKIDEMGWGYWAILEFRSLAHIKTQVELSGRYRGAGSRRTFFPTPDRGRGLVSTNVPIALEIEEYFSDYFPATKNAGNRLIEQLPDWIARATKNLFDGDKEIEGQFFEQGLPALTYDCPVLAGSLLPQILHQMWISGRLKCEHDLYAKAMGLDRFSRALIEIAASPRKRYGGQDRIALTPYCNRDFLEKEDLHWFPSVNMAGMFSVETLLPMMQETLLTEIRGQISYETLALIFDFMPRHRFGVGFCSGRVVSAVLQDLLYQSSAKINQDSARQALNEIMSLPLFARACLEILACNMSMTGRTEAEWLSLLAKEKKGGAA